MVLEYVNELLYGDGTGQHLLGIIPQATAYTAAFAPTAPRPSTRCGWPRSRPPSALYPATGYVMHPTDWAKIELTKDGRIATSSAIRRIRSPRGSGRCRSCRPRRCRCLNS